MGSNRFTIRIIYRATFLVLFVFIASLPSHSQYIITNEDVQVENGMIKKCITSSENWGTGDINIPNILHGQTVTGIYDRVFESKGITSVSLPSTLVFIGDRGFAMNEMVNLTIPKSVTYIGKSLLAAMNTMRNVYFEAESNIRILSSEALFIGSCVNCMSPVVLPTNANPDFSNYYNLNGIILEPGDTIKDLRNAYYAELPVHTLLPEDVTMNDSAITGFITRYPKIEIPGNIGGIAISTIDKAAFYNVSLFEVRLPATIKYIESAAFASNYLNSINFSDGLLEIEASGFENNRLTGLILPSTVKLVGSGAFKQNRISDMVLPESVSFIGKAAFNGNQVVTINGKETNGLIFKPNSDGIIDSSTIVSYCGKSDTIDFIPPTVKILGDDSFTASKINWVELPENLENIGRCAFFNNSIDSVIFPSGLIRLGDQAFGVNYIRKTRFKNPCHLNYCGFAIFSQNYLLDSVILPTPVVKFGYTKFLGWFTDEGDSISAINGIWSESCQARFDPVKFAITYINTGTKNTNYNPPYYTIESNYYLDEPEDSSGYKFAGWYTDPGFHDTVSEPAIPRGSYGDTAFYAKWILNTGLKDISDEEISIYPNPFHEKLTITANELYDITVFDVSGSILLNAKAERGSTLLNIPGERPGLYFIRCTNEKKTIVKKVVMK